MTTAVSIRDLPTLEQVFATDEKVTSAISDLDAYASAVEELERTESDFDVAILLRLLVAADESITDARLLTEYAEKLQDRVLAVYRARVLDAGLAAYRAEGAGDDA